MYNIIYSHNTKRIAAVVNDEFTFWEFAIDIHQEEIHMTFVFDYTNWTLEPG